MLMAFFTRKARGNPQRFLLVLMGAMLLWNHGSFAQKLIKLGAGTYAEYPPLNEAEKPFYKGSDSWGDWSQLRTNMKLYAVDTTTRAIPSAKWWTSLVTTQYSDNLWAYPGVTNAEDFGLYLEYPDHWNNTGTEKGRQFLSNSRIEVRADNYTAASALARRWSDYTLDFIMKDKVDPSKEMAVSLARGVPFTWIETANIKPYIVADSATFFKADGSVQTFPFTGDHFGMYHKGVYYGVFAPNNTTFTLVGKNIYAQYSASNPKGFLVIGFLPSKDKLSFFKTYAYAVPRDSKTTWNYKPELGKIEITYSLTTENLKGESKLDQIMGFLPHHYRKNTPAFAFNGITYKTPRGVMKMATGRSFMIPWRFTGLLPMYPIPEVQKDLKNPFRPTVMDTIVMNYTAKSGYGTDTYWGGKDLLNYARYMQLAAENGQTKEFNIFKDKIRGALEDWFTWTPGESAHYWGWFPKWGSFMGFKTRDNNLPGIDNMQDHHFCYSYHIYAGALLCMYDEDFKAKYGEFLKMIARDYANWDRSYTKLPFFRNLDIWEGHSYAGGMGDFNGNGQESSSEAVHAQGSLYLLGLALNNDSIRDAGIFSYVQEAQGSAEYWFDRAHIPANGGVGNYDYTLYDKPYCSNLTTNGIGWWTYFSGDPFWMHSIQWIPISPVLKYLYEDPTFARWDYTTMWNSKQIGGWDSNLGNEAGVGNLTLSYLNIFAPDSAAAVFDRLWDQKKVTARAPDNNAFTYLYTHAHLTLGEIQWDEYTNLPSSTVYFNSRTQQKTVVVYNPLNIDQICKLYKADGSVQATFIAPAHKLIAHKLDAKLSKIVINSPAVTVAPNTNLQLTPAGYDQYGAGFAANYTYTTTSGSSVNASGVFTSAAAGSYTVTVTSGTVNASKVIRVNASPVLTTVTISPSVSLMEIGSKYAFKSTVIDQYGDPFSAKTNWTTTGGGTIDTTGLFTPTQPGNYTITATAGSKTGSLSFSVRYPLTNVAKFKPAYASSVEKQGLEVWRANDGDGNSRWASASSDPQWWMVNLQGVYDIEKIKINWETAMASSYSIVISSDSLKWDTLYRQPANPSTLNEISMNFTAKYIKVYGKTRATGYGYSIFEFESYGKPHSVNGEAVLTSIVVQPSLAMIKDTVKQKFNVVGYDQNGNQMAVSPTWAVEGKGSIDANGWYTPNGGGTYQQPGFTIIAKASGMSGNATVFVEEVMKPMQISIAPKSSKNKQFVLPVGTSKQFTATTKNQFGIEYPGEVLWTLNGVGTLKADGNYVASTLGTAVIYAVDRNRNTIDTAYITVKPVSQVNLALGKPATASSSEEPVQKGGAAAVDGDLNSLWSSVQQVDPQYLTVDLQSPCALDSAVIYWEAAAAKTYTVQTSVDGLKWDTVGTVNNGIGGTRDVFKFTKKARYVKVNGTSRTTNYGYAIKELEVYGNKIFTDPSVLTSINISPSPASVLTNGSKQFTAQGIDQYGEVMSVSPTWSCTGGGTIAATGLFTASTAGTFSVTAQSGSISKTANITVGGTPTLSKIVLSPSPAQAYANASVQMSALALDQFDQVMSITPNWNISGGGSISTSGLVSATMAGNYTITASSGSVSGTAPIQISNVNTGNLALMKPIIATSEPQPVRFANDGDPNTRWESDATDNQEFYVDLGASYAINRVVISWETASAKTYQLMVSNDAINWTSIKDYSNPGAGINDVAYSGTGRYIKMKGLTRNTTYAYSVFEFEVYGYPAGITANLTSIQVSPAQVSVYANKTRQFSAKGIDQFGGVYPVATTWAVSGGGSIDANGLFTPSASSGTFTVTATGGGKSASTQITIGGTAALNSLSITPAKANVKVTDSYQFTASGLDQFLDPIAVNPTWAINGGGSISSTGLLTTTDKGSYTVTATAGGKTATASVVIGAKNIALNKACTASYNGGMASYATDGDNGSRWIGDVLNPNQWIYVDLQGIYDINSVACNWESACASDYEVMFSYDGLNWNSVYHNKTGKPAYESMAVTGKARFVKIKCNAPATVYGYSLFELEVYGQASKENPQMKSMTITPNPLMAKLNQTTQLTAYGIDQFGTAKPVPATWTVSGGATVDANSILTANQLGEYNLIADYNGFKTGLKFTVVPTGMLSKIVIGNYSKSILVGDTIAFTATGLDQYGDNISLSPQWSVSGGGTIASNGKFASKGVGKYFVTIRSGNVSSTDTIMVNLRTESNLALKKPVVVSSGASSASQAVDGDQGTRWESAQADPSSIMVDLYDSYNLYKVVLNWETASSKVYRIEVGNDTLHMNVAYRCENNPAGGGKNIVYLNATGRYLRIVGEKRNTVYSHSLFEIEAYGQLANATRTLSFVKVSPEAVNVKVGTQKQFSLASYDQVGLPMNLAGNWSVNGNGSINSNGLYTANASGNVNVQASIYQYTSTAAVVNGGNPVLTDLSINPSDTVVGLGWTQQFKAVAKDQFGDAMAVNGSWSISGGGTMDNTGLFTGITPGKYVAQFVQNGLAAYAQVNVKQPNLALNKPTYTSYYAGQAGTNAVDGNLKTRWESAQGNDDEWIMVNLKNNYQIYRVVLNWEAAAAKSYKLLVSDDSITWRTAYTQTNGKGGVETLNLSSVSGKYIKMQGLSRTTQYGYSLYEFEVYGYPVGSSLKLSRLEVSPSVANIGIGVKKQFVANGFDQFGNPYSVSPSWSTTGNGTIDTNGLFTASSVGNATITATAGALSAKSLAAITNLPTLVNITVNPSPASVNAEGSIQFTASGKDQNNAVYAIKPIWKVNGGGTISENGLFTAFDKGSYTAGNYIVSCIAEDLVQNTSLTVTDVSEVRVVNVLPGVSQVAVGQALNLKALLYDQYLQAITGTVTWTSDLGGIDANGRFVGSAVGTSTITARCGNVVGIAKISVTNQPVPQSITLSPANQTISLGSTLQFTAQAKDQFGANYNAYINWQSDGCSIDQNGLFQALALGTFNVKAYSANGLSSSVAVTVTGGSAPVLTSITLSAPASSIATGSSLQITAVGKDQLGNTMTIHPTWSISGTGNTISSTGLLTANTTGNYVVTASQGSVSGTFNVSITSGGINIPGKVEAENYTAMSGIGTEATADTGGGQNVGWIDTNDWMDYTVNVATTGTYTVDFRVASNQANVQMQLLNGSTVLGSLTVPASTGGYQSWQTVSTSMNLTAGSQTIRFKAQTAGFNINWINFSNGSNQAPTVVISSPANNSTFSAGASISLTGTASDADGSIQKVEIFNGSTSLGLATGTNTWSFNWANVAAGTYTLNARATDNGGLTSTASINVTVNAAPVLTTITLSPNPATVSVGQSQQFTAVGKDQYGNTMSISPTWSISGTGNSISTSGLLTASAAGSFTLTATSGTVSGTSSVSIIQAGLVIPGKVEAEAYNSMSGIATEPTADTGGGQNIGYIDAGDWMDYNVNVTTTGTYAVEFRVACWNTAGQLQVMLGSTVLATVALPNTSGGQNWQSVSANISLTAGPQTLRVVCTTGGFNFNYMNFTTQKSLKLAVCQNESQERMLLYPNPATDAQFNLNLSGYEASEELQVRIMDISGRIIQESQLVTDAEGSQNVVIRIQDQTIGGLVFVSVVSKKSIKTQRLILK